MESLRLEIQHDMKMMKTDIEEVKRSVNRSWEEIEEMKSLMLKQREDVDVMKAEILLLKGQVKKERDRNTRLEQYTHQESIRLLNVKEAEDENTEALFKKVLKGQLQRFHKLISNDRIWPSEHGFEVIFEKSLFVFEISAFKVGNKRGIHSRFHSFSENNNWGSFRL